MRNNKFKDLRADWKDSRFFFGKNKVIALALGKTPENEVAEGLSNLSAALKGQCGLLFTNRSKKQVETRLLKVQISSINARVNYTRLSFVQVLNWMEEYEEVEYARSGFVTDESITLPEGPMPEFPHSIEPHLRQLGMPTALKKGIVVLLKDYAVCKKGQTLTPEQARILVNIMPRVSRHNGIANLNERRSFQKLLDRPLATFKLTPLGVFSKKNGYKQLASEDNTKENVKGQMEEEEAEEMDNT